MPHPIISLKPSYNSIVRGCPGLPETLPRIECEFIIRSNDGKPIVIEKIEVILKTTEVLNSSGPSFTSKPKMEKIILHYKKNIRLSEKKIIGIDIPLTIGLPDDIKETNYNKFGHCFTELTCNTFYTDINNNSSLVETFDTIVNIERYNILATNKLFPPLKHKCLSPDKKFLVTYQIENPCITTDDLLNLQLEIVPNFNAGTFNYNQKIFTKKLKLKSIIFEINEILEVYDTHLDSKENTLQSVHKQFNEVIGSNGINLKSNIVICTRNQAFKSYETSKNESSMIYQLPLHQPKLNDTFPETIILKSKNNVEPFQYYCSITTRGLLFSITHILIIKFKISNGKDFEIQQSLDVSPWPKSQLKAIEQIIHQEREIAKNAKDFYNNFGGIKRNKVTGLLEYPPLPPVIYLPDSQTLEHLGILYDMKFKHPRRIPIIE